MIDRQEYYRAYRMAHKEQVAAKDAAYYRAHTEECRARIDAYNDTHREEIRAKRIAYHQTHRDQENESARLWYVANRENRKDRQSMYQAAYHQTHKETDRAKKGRRLAMLRGVSSTERIDRGQVFERDHGICHICKLAVDPKHWHMDHIVPLSKGGAHVMANVSVAHPRCNRSKGAKLVW
jgi:5-methylcytosine-specific restriction endonuclease McrA